MFYRRRHLSGLYFIFTAMLASHDADIGDARGGDASCFIACDGDYAEGGILAAAHAVSFRLPGSATATVLPLLLTRLPKPPQPLDFTLRSGLGRR